jgi:hypothetical protein
LVIRLMPKTKFDRDNKNKTAFPAPYPLTCMYRRTST